MTEIRLKDLRFTLEETKEFFRRAGRIEIGKKELTDLDARLEGWATGIRLISYTLSGKEDLANMIKKLKGSYKTITDYLLSEIIVRQPENISELLMATSVLDRFDESICDYLCSTTDLCSREKEGGRSFISWLRKNNLFTISLDNEGRWFRYHHLFRQLLLRQFEQMKGSDEVSRLQCHLAAYCSEMGRIEEAVRLAVAGDDIDMAAGIIVANRDSLLTEDKWSELEKMLAALPREIRVSNPDLLMAESWIFFSRMNIPALMNRLGIFQQFLDDPAIDKKLKGEYHFLKGYLEYFASKGSEALASHKKAIKMSSEFSGMVMGEAELHLVLSTHMAKGGEKALDIANEMIGRKRKIDSKHRGRLWASSSFVTLLEMELGNAVRSANKMIALSKSDSNNFVGAWGRYLSSNAHLLWNDTEVARELADKVIMDRFILGMRTAVDSYCISILSLIFQGKSAMAQELMIEMAEYSDQIDEMVSLKIADSFRARIAMMNGDMKSAKRWLRTADIEQDRDLMLWWIEVPRITACRILITDAKRDGLERAAGILLDIVNDNKNINNRFQQVMSMPLLAVAMHRLGMADQALETMREAVALAEPARAVCPFMEFHDDMREMIETLKTDDDANDYLNLLLESFSERESISTSDTLVTPKKSRVLRDDFLMEELTNRELTTLRLLSTGLYYKEIADEMAVSKDTVKTHLKHVYQKLRAGSRREAVSIAREAGILDQA
jgi:LuxR family maltose regulon positive regulatory protein